MQDLEAKDLDEFTEITQNLTTYIQKTFFAEDNQKAKDYQTNFRFGAIKPKIAEKQMKTTKDLKA